VACGGVRHGFIGGSGWLFRWVGRLVPVGSGELERRIMGVVRGRRRCSVQRSPAPALGM
jgi:hypothetical protein